MLRIRIAGASALALITFTGVAAAADVQRIPAPPRATVVPAATIPSSWAGHYVGLVGGYGWGGGTIANPGWIGGAYAGFNAEIDRNLIIGIEGDGTLTTKSGSDGTTRVQNPWDATLRARIGFGTQQWLFYGTGGIAFGQVKATTAGTTESATKTGWTVGTGLEAKVSPNATARVEYRYTNLGTSTFTTSPSIAYHSNDLLLGVGVKF
jgi:outer membrane immunogenic protein